MVEVSGSNPDGPTKSMTQRTRHIPCLDYKTRTLPIYGIGCELFSQRPVSRYARPVSSTLNFPKPPSIGAHGHLYWLLMYFGDVVTTSMRAGVRVQSLCFLHQIHVGKELVITRILDFRRLGLQGLGECTRFSHHGGVLVEAATIERHEES